MLVLGIDTATKVGGLGLFHSESGLLGEYNLALEQTHSERLMPMLDSFLKSAGLTIHAIQGFAVSIGPGSFTGVRIGVTSAKTLAQITAKPIIGISTMEVVSYNLANVTGIICPIFDARNRRVYTGQFLGNGAGIVRITEDDSMTIEELVEKLQERFKERNEKIYFLGDAISLYQDYLTRQLGRYAVFTARSFWMPKGGVVAQLGCERLVLGEGDELYTLCPNYLKPAEAEVNWQKKYGGR